MRARAIFWSVFLREMGFTRRVARAIVWVGGTVLILAAAMSLAQGSSPTDWDLHNVVHHLPDANQLSQLQDRIGQDLHAAADAVDPYWHAAADAMDPYWHAAVDAVDPYWHAAADAADPYIKTATDNVRSAVEVVDPYLHGAVDASRDVLHTAADAAGGVVRQGIEVMKPYVDDEMYEMMAAAARSPWGMGGEGDADGEGGEGGGGEGEGKGEGEGGGFQEEQPASQSPEGESTLGQWVGRDAEKPAITSADDSSSSSSSSSSSESQEQQRRRTELLNNVNFHDVGALAMPMPAAAPKPKPPKPAAAARAPTGRRCARAFTDDGGGCKKVIKLPECAGSPYRGNYWTVSKAAVRANPGNRHFKGFSSTLISQLPPTSPFDGEPFESCALVSSSRDMLKRKQGALVDSHAVVMRINGAPTKAGYRATYWSIRVRVVSLDTVSQRRISRPPMA